MGLRFKSIKIHEISIPFRLGYTHALASRKEANSFILCIKTECGQKGYGESIPRSYLTGESMESVWHDIMRRWWPRVRDIEIDSYNELLPKLNDIYLDADRSRHTASYTGVELACIDAAGKAFKTPARNLIKKEPDKISETPFHCTGPIGTRSKIKSATLARIFNAIKFRDIKIKVGFDNDEKRLQKIRKICGPRVNLRADANAAWKLDQALENCEMLRRYNITSIEQPLAHYNIKEMAKINLESGLPVMADESLCTQEDADILIKEKACDIFNIRLGKCGGFSGGRAVYEKMKQANLKCQIGVLVGETSILTAAQQEFMYGIGEQLHHEAGFPKILLKRDPANGAQSPFWRGIIKEKSPRPGLGITVNSEILDRITVQKKEA